MKPIIDRTLELLEKHKLLPKKPYEILEHDYNIYKSFYELIRDAEYQYDQRKLSVQEFVDVVESGTKIVFHHIEMPRIDKLIDE